MKIVDLQRAKVIKTRPQYIVTVVRNFGGFQSNITPAIDTVDDFAVTVWELDRITTILRGQLNKMRGQLIWHQRYRHQLIIAAFCLISFVIGISLAIFVRS